MEQPGKSIELWFWAIILLFWAAGLYFHEAGGFYYPQPYCDEVYFFYPARSFAESNSFFAAELHSKRTLLWMPFGYVFVCGLVFKWLGSNLLYMREVSFFSISVAYFALAYGLKIWRFRIVLALVLGLFFLSNPWVGDGSTGRMESTVLAFLCLGFTLGSFQKWRLAWFALFCTALFHPIGYSFLLCFGIFWWLKAERKQIFDVFIPGVLVLPLWFVANFGLEFPLDIWLKDWEFQVAGKTEKGFRLLFFRWRTLAIFLVVAGLVFYIFRRKKFNYLPWVVMFPLLYLARIFGQGGNYGIYTSLGFFFFSVVMIEILFSEMADRQKNGLLSYFALILFILGLIGSSVIQVPFYSKDSISVKPIREAPEYLSEPELAEVRTKLDSICLSKGWKTLYIYPESVGARLYHKNQAYTQIIHNFEDTAPDGVLYFTKKGDSFAEEREVIWRQFQTHDHNRIRMNLGHFSPNWNLYPNVYKKLNPNRFDALDRCAKAGIVCPS